MLDTYDFLIIFISSVIILLKICYHIIKHIFQFRNTVIFKSTLSKGLDCLDHHRKMILIVHTFYPWYQVKFIRVDALDSLGKKSIQIRQQHSFLVTKFPWRCASLQSGFRYTTFKILVNFIQNRNHFLFLLYRNF